MDDNVKAAVLAEREACAVVAASFGEPYAVHSNTGAMMFRAVTSKIADAIRSRSERED